ncbi:MULTISPECIES: sugar ABC transporter substrate-binding protein [unclassified Devosia]|uniref:sugar ABC transporter substrate-binding protein n=1 Tax=unclassified Devosia TaxID=196773 RepID=UPI0025F61343|nr:sugar ABC transporter substrate-binding protein [Devosia sp.]MCR6636885.1 sugar ABC transporter substrate-binding protein [Devosia sp.]
MNRFLKAATAAALLCTLVGGSAAYAQDIVGLITKTEGNPFFVKMREGAQAKATELGLDLRTYAGEFDGDNESQIAAIESLIAAGAKGFAIVPSDSSAIVPTIQQARDAGLLVIVLDTPLEPMDAADATFATDNRQAGRLIGQWAAGTLGDEAANAKIGFLDLATNQPTVDYLRDQGFMEGFGIDVKDPNRYGDEDDARICGHEVTAGSEEGGVTAMETLLQRCPDINVVYAINEPAAAGGYQALQAAGVENVLIVAVDGGCPGVQNVKDGIIGATSQQYPLDMAALALEAIAKFAADGSKPEVDPELGFYDTGARLVTDKPVDGVESIDTTEGAELCWG